MNNNDIKYFLGIDGGGTKTEFLLRYFNGTEIGRLVLGGTNPVTFGLNSTYEVLSEGINRICNNLNYNEVSVFAGIAGLRSGNFQKLVNQFIKGFGFGCCDCDSDVALVLENALSADNGTAVIMGTGIVSYTRFGENFFRSGGRGYMIDKGGSGFHFGSDALNAAFEFIDGRGGSELILNIIENTLCKSLEDSVSDIYGGGPSFVASFAPVVFEAYRADDPVAIEIVDRNACEAMKIINGSRVNTADKIVVCGGLCKQKDILYPNMIKYIKGNAELSFCDSQMVNAALVLAERLCKNA